MSAPFFIISNYGQAIAQTNYWDSQHAANGLFYLSWNAGAARILIPDNQKRVLKEMKPAREVIISRGPLADLPETPDALEMLWEDDSDEPYSITILALQTDRLIPQTDQGGGFIVAAWTRGGLKHRWPGRYRVVDALPCLKPWESN